MTNGADHSHENGFHNGEELSNGTSTENAHENIRENGCEVC